MVVIERPMGDPQIYIASGLRDKFHFSIPTAAVPILHKFIKEHNNDHVKILFIPRTCQYFESDCYMVLNKVTLNKSVLMSMDIQDIIETTIKESPNISSKRSDHSISIGQQTIYSHQQHIARYCMLPHSKPHIPTVKHRPKCIRLAMLAGYKYCLEMLANCSHNMELHHPFLVDNRNDDDMTERISLRSEILCHLIGYDIDNNGFDIPTDVMFESCSIQPTSSLGFHQDTLNCPLMDSTIALHIPNDQQCLSLLYYSRKCVGEYAIRMSNLQSFHSDESACDLSKLCLKSIMATGSNFDYQALFEHEEALDDIGQQYEQKLSNRCDDLSAFCGTKCFKMGAAFDKMGYYSIFVNVFISMFYNKVILNVDDSIGLCMYFGLLCNGTSNLTSVWNELQKRFIIAKQFYDDRVNEKTRVFQLLVMLDKDKRRDTTNKVVGNCKLPRFQFANYSEYVIEQSETIHQRIKDFLLSRISDVKKRTPIASQHAKLFKILHVIKGVGPLNFNQLWHSLSLCGLLPHNYIQSSVVGKGTSPAKLIQIYYPECKSSETLTKALMSITSTIS